MPFYWLAILVLAALLAGAVFLLVRPPADSDEASSDTADGQVSEGPPDQDEQASDDSGDELEETPESENPETGPLRAKLTDAVAGFEVKAWAESAGMISYGAVEAYEGFYVRVDASASTGAGEDAAEVVEPTLIAAGRWESRDEAAEWLTEWAEEQAVLPTELRASGLVPGVEGEDVGEYRYFESSDNSEAGVAWTNRDLGLLLVGAPEVVELLFTQLPL